MDISKNQYRSTGGKTDYVWFEFLWIRRYYEYHKWRLEITMIVLNNWPLPTLKNEFYEQPRVQMYVPCLLQCVNNSIDLIISKKKPSEILASRFFSYRFLHL